MAKIEILNDIFGKSKSNTKYLKLYNGIKDGKIKTDEDAARILYKTDPSDKKYQMLKSRFKEKLQNNLFFLDVDKKYESKYFKNLYKCDRELFVAKVMIAHGARNQANKILERILPVTEKYEFRSLQIETISRLRFHSSLSGSHRKVKELDDQLKVAQNLYSKELRTNSIWDKLICNFAKSSAYKVKKNIEEINQALVEFRKIRNEEGGTSFNIDYLYYRLEIISLQFHKKYVEAVEMADQAIKTLGKQPHLFTTMKLGDFLTDKIISLLHLKDYENGRKAVEYCLTIFHEGTNNWFFFQEIYFLLAMQTKRYTSSQKIFKKVTNHPRFKDLPRNRQEKWRIFEAYLVYALNTLFSAKAVISEPEPEHKPTFKVEKFMNDVPIYSKDKKGMNIAILIIQILFYLENGNYEKIVDRMDSLNQYGTRYLRKNENYRSNIFIKMLQLMEKEDFDFERTRELGQKYLQKLNESKYQFDENYGGVEIIPFEYLWDNILVNLKEHNA